MHIDWKNIWIVKIIYFGKAVEKSIIVKHRRKWYVILY